MTSQESGAGERRHTARDGLLAIAFAETMRPVVARWADDPPRQVYDEVMSDLWRGNLAGDTGARRLAELEKLPEFESADANHRDFYVCLVLELAHLAIEIVLAAAVGAKVGRPWLGLNNLFEELSSALFIRDLPTEFLNAASRIDPDDPNAISKMQHLATQMAKRVNDALAPTAITLGWTVERPRP